MIPRQERFVEEYLVDLNATGAAIRAGYSEHTASAIGHENLRKPEIQNAIQEYLTRQSEHLKLKAQDVIADLIRIKNRCMQLEETSSGKVAQLDVKHALKAIERPGKHTGCWDGRGLDDDIFSFKI